MTMGHAEVMKGSVTVVKRAGRVAGVGSLNMDLVVRAARLPRPGETLAGASFAMVPGGKGGNQAVAAARLGAQVAMVGRIGADAHGLQLHDGLTAEGIECATVQTCADIPTGVALIVVDDSSQNAIVIVPGANGALTPADVARAQAVLAAADVVVCQMEVPHDTVAAVLAAARRLHKTVVLNPAPVTGPLLPEWLDAVDFLIPNELEAAALSGLMVDSPATAQRAAERLRSQGAHNVLITLGAKGVLAAMADGGRQALPCEPRCQRRYHGGWRYLSWGALRAALAAGRPVADAIRFGQAAAGVIGYTAPVLSRRFRIFTK